MSVRALVHFREGVEYGIGSKSASVQENEEVAEKAAEGKAWYDDAVDITSTTGADSQEEIEEVGVFAYARQR